MDIYGRDINSTFLGDVYIDEDLEVHEDTKIGGDLTIDGSLIVKDQIAYEDAVIILNDLQGRLNDSFNWGLIAPYFAGSQFWSGLVRSFTDSRFKLINASATEITSTQTTFANLGSMDLFDLKATSSITVPLISDTTLTMSAGGTQHVFMDTTNLDLGEVLSSSQLQGCIELDVFDAKTNVNINEVYVLRGFAIIFSSTIMVTSIGYQNTLQQSPWTLVNTAIYDSIGNRVASAIINMGSDPLINISRFHALNTPVFLNPGEQYYFAACQPGIGSGLENTASYYSNTPNMLPLQNAVTSVIRMLGPGLPNGNPPSFVSPASFVQEVPNWDTAGCCDFLYNTVIPAIRVVNQGVIQQRDTDFGDAKVQTQDIDAKVIRFTTAQNLDKISIQEDAGGASSLFISDNNLTTIVSFNSNINGIWTEFPEDVRTKHVESVGNDTFDIGTPTHRYLTGEFKNMNTATTSIEAGLVSAPSLLFKTTTDGLYHTGTSIAVASGSTDLFDFAPTVNTSVNPLYSSANLLSGGYPTKVAMCSLISTVSVNGSITTDQSIINTGSLIGSLNIPANSVKQGNRFDITCSGRQAWIDTDQASVYIKIGTLKVVTLAVQFPTQANAYWSIKGSITARTNSSANTTFACDMFLTYINAPRDVLGSGAELISSTVDGTVANDIDVGIAFSQVDASNIFTCKMASIDATFL